MENQSNIPVTQRKFGTPIKDLKDKEPELYQRVRDHLGEEYTEYTAGEASHYDVDYGGADPRVEAANKNSGDFTSLGSSGPRKAK